MSQETRDPHHPVIPEPDQAPPERAPGIFDLAFLTGVPNVAHVCLVRHAQQAVDPTRPVGELVDPPLSDLGRRQAEAVAAVMARRPLTAIYCSTLRRARDTALAIARHHGLTPVEIHDLREIETWRDMPQDKTVQEYLGANYLAALRERMIAERDWDVYPYSESMAEFRRRTINAIEAALAAHPAARIAIVCHGAVINAYTGHLIGSPYGMYFRPAHASISLVAAGHGRRALRSLNDVSHLAADGLETY